jgi:hypothetical protein
MVRQVHGSIFDRLGKALHAQYDQVASQPLPERWIDLIRYLDEKERRQASSAEAEAEPREPWDPSNSARKQ